MSVRLAGAKDGWSEATAKSRPPPYITNSFYSPLRSSQVHPSFKKAVFIAFLGPYVIALLWMISVTSSYTLYMPFVAFNNEASEEDSIFQNRPAYVDPNSEMTTSSGFIVFLCMAMDMSNIFWLAKHVFCLWPAWLPEVSIDTNPRNNWLRVGKQKVILTDIKEVREGWSQATAKAIPALSESRKGLGCGMGIVAVVTEEEGLVWKYKRMRFLPLLIALSICRFAPRPISPNILPSRFPLPSLVTPLLQIHRFSKKFCWYVTVLYILGGMPWCSTVMIVKSFWLPYEQARIVIGCFGFVSCFRAFFGASVFAKFHFAMEFILTTNSDMRDDMGLSMRDEKVRYLGFYSYIVVTVSVGLIISTYYFQSRLHTFLTATICGFFGGVYGVVLGLLQGLPTSPQFLLTRWPDEGHTVLYDKKMHCPCIFYCAYCSDMHTRQGYLVLFLDNMQGYQSMLKGETEVGDDFDPMAG